MVLKINSETNLARVLWRKEKKSHFNIIMEGILLGIGNPLLDIQVHLGSDTTLLEKYFFVSNPKIQAES